MTADLSYWKSKGLTTTKFQGLVTSTTGGASHVNKGHVFRVYYTVQAISNHKVGMAFQGLVTSTAGPTCHVNKGLGFLHLSCIRKISYLDWVQFSYSSHEDMEVQVINNHKAGLAFQG